jgi:hypothetical protein
MTPQYLRDWGKHTHGSPLYLQLAEVVATDADLLRVIGRIEHQPPPNLLFAAVHYMLMNGEGPDLARFYASIAEEPLPSHDVGPLFRQFVLDNEDRIVEMGNTRYTQTNESRRCVALLPMVMMAPFDRFHLIEVGTSAGLNLGLDRYHYRYDGLEWGPPSWLTLSTESRGATPKLRWVEVRRRIGLDLNPIEPDDVEARRWLDALIWPEHAERRGRLRAALEVAGSMEIEMVSGDALLTLPEVLSDLPGDEPVVVMNSFVLIQFTEDQRRRLETITEQARAARPVHRVSMEALVKSDDWAQLVVDDGSGPRTVGQAHPHGDWVELSER